jgi:hypothetical protein
VAGSWGGDRIPPEVVAAIVAAVVRALDGEAADYRILIRGRVPTERPDAGLYREFGLVELFGRRRTR